MNPKTVPSNAVDKPITLAGSGAKRRNEIFVDIFERIHVTFNSDVCDTICRLLCIVPN